MKTADELTQRYSVVAQKAAIAENAACAELVRAAGCNCFMRGERTKLYPPGQGNHYEDCPQALADAIEARIKA